MSSSATMFSCLTLKRTDEIFDQLQQTRAAHEWIMKALFWMAEVGSRTPQHMFWAGVLSYFIHADDENKRNSQM